LKRGGGSGPVPIHLPLSLLSSGFDLSDFRLSVDYYRLRLRFFTIIFLSWRDAGSSLPLDFLQAPRQFFPPSRKFILLFISAFRRSLDIHFEHTLILWGLLFGMRFCRRTVGFHLKPTDKTDAGAVDLFVFTLRTKIHMA
jgi:hypothetical protein